MESYDDFLIRYFKTNTQELNTYCVLVTTYNTQLLEGSKLKILYDEDDDTRDNEKGIDDTANISSTIACNEA